MARVLVVDDEPGVRFGIRAFLESKGYEVDEAGSCAEAEGKTRATPPDAVTLDFRLPDGTALDVLPKLRAVAPDLPVVVLTAHGSIDVAVQAIKMGAEQFLIKPVELSALEVLLSRLVEGRRSRRNREVLDGRGEKPNPFLGTSAAIRALEERTRRLLEAESPLLILGETGSGKGLLARWIHDHGPRAREPFVDLNCAGLSREFLESELFGHERGAFTGAVAVKPGLFEVAHRGTLFLDEIGDVDAQVQPKLLKVLEEKRFRRLGDVKDRVVDARLVAATHHDLPALVADGRFRRDLYFRISTLPLHLPALRERAEDLPLLANELLARIGRELGRSGFTLSDGALEALREHRWPGNVRELRNVLERAALLGRAEVLTEADLMFDPQPGADPDEVPTVPDRPATDASLAEVERRHIAQVLEEEQGRVEPAARRLAIPRSTLYQKIRQYGLPRKTR